MKSKTTLATLLLTGAIAITASGCTAEIKAADGTPIGNVVINEEAISSGITINQKGEKVVTEQENVLPEDNFDEEKTPSASASEESRETDPVEDTDNEPAVTETEAKTTAKPTAAVTPENDAGPAKGAIAAMKEGASVRFNEVVNPASHYVEGNFGRISFYTDADSKVHFQYNNKEIESTLPIRNPNLSVSEAYLFKKDGRLFIYISAMHGGDICEINVYELNENAFVYVGCAENLHMGELRDLNNFSCYEHFGRNYMFFLYGDYKVGSNGMPQALGKVHSVTNSSYSRLKSDTSANVIKDGKVTNEQRILVGGDIFDLKRTDLENYIDVVAYDGTEYRIYCKSSFTAETKNKSNGIFDVFEIAKDYDETKKGTVGALNDGQVINFHKYDGRMTINSIYGNYIVENNIDNQKIQITYNRHAYVLPVKTDGSGLTIGKSYLLKSDGKVYIYVTSMMTGEISSINVYEVSESAIKYNGSYDGIKITDVIEYTTKFMCREYDGMNGCISICRYYKVGKNGIPAIADYMCYITVSCKVRASQDITGYVVKDGKATSEKITITKGSRIIPIEFNEVSYIDIKDEASGKTVRVNFEPLLNQYYDQNDHLWIYKAVLSLIEPAI